MGDFTVLTHKALALFSQIIIPLHFHPRNSAVPATAIQ